MKKALLCLFLALYSSGLLAQEQSKRLTFILFIDSQLPTTGITDGMFLLKDSSGVIKDKMPFDYHVGGLVMAASDYEKLFKSTSEYRIFVKFKYAEFRPENIQNTYEKEIPKGWLNDEYIILKVYNYANKANRAEYVFKPREEYLIQIKIPASSTILITHKK